MMKSIALAALLVVLLGLIGVQYYITSVPALEAPVTVGDVREVKPEQSLVVTLVDSEGQRFTIGLRGDTAKPEEVALFYIRRSQHLLGFKGAQLTVRTDQSLTGGPARNLPLKGKQENADASKGQDNRLIVCTLFSGVQGSSSLFGAY